MVAQIQNKVCDTIPYEFIQEKIIIPVTVNGVNVKYIVDTGGRTGTMYDAATEMKATAAGYMRISDVNAQGSNYQEAHVQNVSIGKNYKIKQLKTMVLSILHRPGSCRNSWRRCLCTVGSNIRFPF